MMAAACCVLMPISMLFGIGQTAALTGGDGLAFQGVRLANDGRFGNGWMTDE